MVSAATWVGLASRVLPWITSGPVPRLARALAPCTYRDSSYGGGPVRRNCCGADQTACPPAVAARGGLNIVAAVSRTLEAQAP